MKKRKIILSALMPVAAVAATTGIVAGTLTLTSCSSSRLNPSINTYDVNLKDGSKPSTYSNISRASINRPTILPNASTNNVQGVVDEIDANFNQNPFIQMQDKFGGNVKKLIEEDVNDIILEFLSCMEQEQKNGKQELEIELMEKEDFRWSNPIQITSAKFDENFLETKKISVTADVWVEYEYEKGKIEIEGEKKIRNVSFDLYAEFAGRDEILALTKKVAQKKHEISAGNNKKMDYEDIMELLVGERDSDPFDYDFDDLFERRESSIDEIGLLKYMSNYNDLTSSNAKMFGYSFDVLEFWNNLTLKWNEQNPKYTKAMPRANLNKSDFYFWAPSSAVCNIFVPKLNNGTDLNASVQKIIKDHNGFSGLTSTLNKLVSNSANNYSELRTWLAKYGISFPESINFTRAWLEREVDFSIGQGMIKKIELKVNDQYGNKYEFEFYSNWWRNR